MTPPRLLRAWVTSALVAALLVADARADDTLAFSMEGIVTFTPDGDDTILPIFKARVGGLHLEARYNYEDFFAGSLWGGWVLGVEGPASIEVIPMLGAVLGALNGVALGLEVDATWWRLNLYSEAEQVFDLSRNGAHFFYAWSTLSAFPAEWAWVGASLQSTVEVGEKPVLDAGPVLGVGWGDLSAELYWFRPLDERTTWVFVLGVSF